MSSSNTLCSKCFNAFKSPKFIACHICKARFHLICGNMDEKVAEHFNNNKNLVFYCDHCLNLSSDLIVHISLLTKEISEIKESITAANNSVKVSHTICSTNVRDNNVYSNENNVKISRVNNNKNNKIINSANDGVRLSQQSVGVNCTKTLTSDDVFVDAVDAVGALCDVSLPTTSSFSAGNAVLKSQGSDLPANSTFSEWSTVRNKNQKRQKIVYGDSNEIALEVIPRKKWVHISSFKPSVTEEDVINYVVNRTSIVKEHLSCYKLVKKDTPLDEIRFANFKLGVMSSQYDQLFNPSLWQSNVRVRPFKFFPKRVMTQMEA